MSRIGIIDYHMGNLRSVQKAFEFIGADAVILHRSEDVESVDKLVLPGVGSFADAMKFLNQMGWIEPIRKHIEAGKPFLGICLGMQLIFEGSEEEATPGEIVPGLGILPGKVVRFNENMGDGGLLKVPQMGWNAIHWDRNDPLFDGLEQDSHVYFVHSYHVQPTETAETPISSARADYGGEFTATVWKGNVWATQFHPEKSQRIGLRILKNFAAI
ncbi:imidazole glycerol phosphate synthase subunit HisH [Planctomycetota bacterium]|nr:imidazole glycerol phosphate synthase subunit HisH [Planctomycetota bacterium]